MEPQLDLQPGLVRVVWHDGSYDEHQISKETDQPSCAEQPTQGVNTQPVIDTVSGHTWSVANVQLDGSQTGITKFPRSDVVMKSITTPPKSNEENSTEGLNESTQAHLLELAACLLRHGDKDMATALIKGLAALSYGGYLSGYLSSDCRCRLKSFLDNPSLSVEELAYPAQLRIRELLQEVNRLDHLYTINGPHLAMDDNRPRLDVGWTTLGPFSAPLSRLRIALLPDEADHVELYDIRVGEFQDCPIGAPMISRLPEYTPDVVREVPEPVNINGTLVRKYLPGTRLAGQLRNGADPSRPKELSPNDLLGGVELDLGRTFPPMSYVYLFYRVAPGHVFCAAVEPIEPRARTTIPTEQSLSSTSQ